MIGQFVYFLVSQTTDTLYLDVFKELHITIEENYGINSYQKVN